MDAGDTVNLSGSGSDPEGDPVSYSWSQTGGSPNVSLTGSTTATPSFTAPSVTADATLTFRLLVRAGSDSAADTVDVTVRAAALPTPSLSIDSPSVTEGDSGTASLTFTVTLSAASGSAVTVGYADAGTGTATSGTDYTALSPGTLTFAAGETSKTVTVQVRGDTTDEPHQTVVVQLSGATNASIFDGVRDGDDPGRRRLAVAVGQFTERDGGGQRNEEPDVHGDVERGEREACPYGVRADGGHGDAGDGLHDDAGEEPAPVVDGVLGGSDEPVGVGVGAGGTRRTSRTRRWWRD